MLKVASPTTEMSKFPLGATIVPGTGVLVLLPVGTGAEVVPTAAPVVAGVPAAPVVTGVEGADDGAELGADVGAGASQALVLEPAGSPLKVQVKPVHECKNETQAGALHISASNLSWVSLSAARPAASEGTAARQGAPKARLKSRVPQGALATMAAMAADAKNTFMVK